MKFEEFCIRPWQPSQSQRWVLAPLVFTSILESLGICLFPSYLGIAIIIFNFLVLRFKVKWNTDLSQVHFLMFCPPFIHYFSYQFLFFSFPFPSFLGLLLIWQEAPKVVLIQDSNLGVLVLLRKEKFSFSVHMMHLKTPFGNSLDPLKQLNGYRS